MRNSIKSIVSVLIIASMTLSSALAFAAEPTNIAIQETNGFTQVIEELKGTIDSKIEEVINKFKDMTNHWAKDLVGKLVDSDILNGYSNGTFRPDNSITRAEFTKILVSALHNDPGNAESDHWADLYMEIATDERYVLDGEFSNLDKEITRGEMARMISRVLEEDPENIDKLKKQIIDFNKIPGELKEHVARVYAAGIITGYNDGSFKHDRSATRAEASAMLLRLLDTDERQIPEVKEVLEGVTHINDLDNEDITKYIDSDAINHPFYYEVVDPDLPSVKRKSETITFITKQDLPVMVNGYVIHSIESYRRNGMDYIMVDQEIPNNNNLGLKLLISNKDFSILRSRNNYENFTEDLGNGLKRTYYPIWAGHADTKVDSNSWDYRGEGAEKLIFRSSTYKDVLCITMP